MSTRRENIQNQLKNNGRARMMMVIVGIVVLIMLVFGLMSIFKTEQPATNDTGSLPAPPRIQNVPGASSDDRYNELQRLENERLAEAARPGETILPTQVADSNPNANTPFLPESPADLPGLDQPDAPDVAVIPPPPTPEAVPVVPVVPAAPVYQTPPPQVVVAPTPQHDPRVLQQRYNETATQLNNYLAAWAVVPQGAQEFNYTGQMPPTSEASGAAGSNFNTSQASMGGSGSMGYGSGNTGTGNTASAGNKQPQIARAGTVIPAVLLSVINSDNPGPVLAQITTGPLAGTRLLGSFQATEKAVILSFEKMTKPGMGSFNIDAVAVDERYAVGMASDVDNHYFRRYGLLLAGSLLQGYGEAMSRANTTIVTGPFGTTSTQGELDDSQMAAVALGQVGRTMSQELINESRVKPTVHLDCKGGCPVGILFMSDL